MSVELDIVLSSHRKRAAVSGERVVGDGVVEEVMNFWGHGCECDRRSSLLPQSNRIGETEVEEDGGD